MISIFRKLRFKSLSSRYIAYAIGETVLIILGILIALSIGNWNDDREFEQYETLMLGEISTALKRNRATIDSAYLPRLELKEQGIAELMRLSISGKPVTETEIVENLNIMSIDFMFTYDSGAYEALKSSGIDRLSNEQLRTNLISFYDSFLPTWKEFIDMVDEELNQTIIQKRFKILTNQVVEIENGEYELRNRLIEEDVLNHNSFLVLIGLESQKAGNQRRRLNVIIPNLDELISEIDKELTR